MFDRILGRNKIETKKDDENKEIKEKISKMSLSDMRVYVNNNLNNFEICEDGLFEIMKQLMSVDTNGNKFIGKGAMDSKIKKAFDLVIIIGSSKKMTVSTSESINEFIEFYSDVIDKFDKDNKQIYKSKLKNALAVSLLTLDMMNDMNQKTNILG